MDRRITASGTRENAVQEWKDVQALRKALRGRPPEKALILCPRRDEAKGFIIDSFVGRKRG